MSFKDYKKIVAAFDSNVGACLQLSYFPARLHFEPVDEDY